MITNLDVFFAECRAIIKRHPEWVHPPEPSAEPTKVIKRAYYQRDLETKRQRRKENIAKGLTCDGCHRTRRPNGTVPADHAEYVKAWRHGELPKI